MCWLLLIFVLFSFLKLHFSSDFMAYFSSLLLKCEYLMWSTFVISRPQCDRNVEEMSFEISCSSVVAGWV